MISLDHTILHVRSHAASLDFYQHVLGLRYEGKAGPFEVLRINPGLTLDLMQQTPKEPVHLAFSVDRATFNEVQVRLRQLNIAFGGDVFERDGQVASNSFGARGRADALYFYDSDQHNLELRVYDK